MKDKIEKKIELQAPISVVWKALTDHHEFGEWFHVIVEKPFVEGQKTHGKLTYPGFEDYPWVINVKKIEPQRLFSFTWNPYAIDKKRDYSKETPTLIEFKLEKSKNGTSLILTETGFEKIPQDRREEAYSMNDEGWTEQMENIKSYLQK